MFILRKVKQHFLNYINIRESKNSPPPFNERFVEYAFVLKKLSEIYPKTVLDVGTGTTPLPSIIQTSGSKVVAIDNIVDYWPDGMVNKHFYVINEDITRTKMNDRFDAITCISVLEHIDRFDDAISNMSKLLNPGGLLLLTCPYNELEYCENVYDLPNSNAKGMNIPYKTRSFSRKNIEQWTSKYNLELVDQEFWKFFDGNLWTVGNKIFPPIKSARENQHQISCMAFKKI